ncbi:MAG: EAL domain-containing protein, partial [Oceanospirillales bacterium]
IKGLLKKHRAVNQVVQFPIRLKGDYPDSLRLLLCKHLHDSNGDLLWLFSIYPIPTQIITDACSNKESTSSTLDELTKLPNRSLFAERLYYAQALSRRQSTAIAVLFIDLDGFKYINDHFGHDAGDFVLTTIAKRLKALFRETDTIARFGGDEFCGLLTGLELNSIPGYFLQRLIQVISEGITYRNFILKVTGSIGVTFYPQPDELAPDQLIRQADQAMYKAKQSGKNKFYIFDQALDRKERVENKLLKEIEDSFKNNQFTLHYLPKINLSNDAFIGVEALLRWNHPVRGTINAAEFIDFINSTSIATELGDWVIDEVLKKLFEWKNIGFKFTVSINVSVEYIISEGFIEKLRKKLSVYPLNDNSLLEFEIRDTGLLENFSQVNNVLHACKKLGVQIAYDNFGKGFLSLSSLWKMPVGRIKIDPSFVRAMLSNSNDHAIVKAVIGIGAGLGHQVVASGIESQEIANELLLNGCNEGEGYGISRPMPAEDIPNWVLDWIKFHPVRQINSA